MAQQVFPQWSPVVRALDENNNEVLLPFAGIHAQTRDGKDEIIVGAGNMVWTGTMWVPVSDQNRLPVEATLSGGVVTLREIAESIAIPANENREILDLTSLGSDFRAIRVALRFSDYVISGIDIRFYRKGTTTPVINRQLVETLGPEQFNAAEFDVFGTGRIVIFVINRSDKSVDITAGEILGVR